MSSTSAPSDLPKNVPWWAEFLHLSPEEFSAVCSDRMKVHLREVLLGMITTDEFIPAYVATAFRVNRSEMVTKVLTELEKEFSGE